MCSSDLKVWGTAMEQVWRDHLLALACQQHPAGPSALRSAAGPPAHAAQTGLYGSHMTARGIHHLYVTTHDYAATVAFWTSMGFTVGFETDHGSAQLLPPAGGPYLFVDTAEAGAPASVELYLDANPPEPSSPGWEATHWGTSVKRSTDPDGRAVWLQHEP